jgi:hypothetical protein
MEENLKINEHRRSRHLPARSLSPEQAAALRKRTMQWREEWRAEVAARRGEANGHGPAAPGQKATPAKKRANDGRFAAAVARQEFGRFYWNGKLAGHLAKTMKERPAKRRSRPSDRAIN